MGRRCGWGPRVGCPSPENRRAAWATFRVQSSELELSGEGHPTLGPIPSSSSEFQSQFLDLVPRSQGSLSRSWARIRGVGLWVSPRKAQVQTYEPWERDPAARRLSGERPTTPPRKTPTRSAPALAHHLLDRHLERLQLLLDAAQFAQRDRLRAQMLLFQLLLDLGDVGGEEALREGA